MSRHKLVKNMNVDEELDMYDGYDEDSNGEEGRAFLVYCHAGSDLP